MTFVNFFEINDGQSPVSVLPTADQRIVAVLDRFTVVRYLADGGLDEMFGEGGRFALRRGYEESRATAAALQTDGAVVAAGYTGSTLNDDLDILVVRFNADGSLDGTFGNRGRVITDAFGDDSAHAVVIQPDGRILVTGIINRAFGLARYQTDGTLDPEFSLGTVFTHVGDSNSAAAFALELQPDGKILAAGQAFVSGNDYDAALVRYNPDGTVDTNFGSNGRVTTDFGGNTDKLVEIIMLDDGSIVGRLDSAGSAYLVRYGANGTYDASFGQVPIVNDAVAPFSYRIRALEANQIRVIGASAYNGVSLSIYGSDGTLLNSTLGPGNVDPGVVSNYTATTVAELAQGGFAVGGTSSDGIESRLTMVRYLANGQLDNGFEDDAVAITSSGWSEDVAYAAAMQNDGRLVLAGISGSNVLEGSRFAVTRLDPRGFPDPAFVSNFEGPGSCCPRVGSVVVDPYGRIAVAGTDTGVGEGVLTVRRYTAAGEADGDFSGDGQTSLSIGTRGDQARGLIARPEGNLIVAGTTFETEDSDFLVARFDPDGNLDLSFGTGPGYTTIDFGPFAIAWAATTDSNGRIVIVGAAWNGTNSDYAVARVAADGLLDTTFGGGAGFITLPIGAGADEAYAVAIQEDGKIIVAGETGGSDFALVRLLEDGTLDATFGSNGIVTASVGGFDTPRSIILQKDGRILLAGTASSVGEVLLRFDGDGLLDESFGDSGVFHLDLDSVHETIRTPSGLLAVGTADGDFAVQSVLLADGGIADQLVASVLPTSRSVQVGTPATAFATIINYHPEDTAESCSLAPFADVGDFLFQTTNPATNALTGVPNSTVSIPPSSFQTFLFALTPKAPFPPTNLALSFDCASTTSAPVIGSVNTLLISASSTPVPDVVALAATSPNDGIVRLADAGAFAVATINVGTSGRILASPDTGSSPIPVTLQICETNPSTGECLAPPSGTATKEMAANATATFGVFVFGTDEVGFNPARTRVFVRFRDEDGVVRGATSVAVCTSASASCPP